MQKTMKLEAEITEEGQLLVDLPADSPRGHVVLTVEPAAADDVEIEETSLQGLGLTVGEIARAPEIGAWAGSSSDMDGSRYVDEQRGRDRRYRW